MPQQTDSFANFPPPSDDTVEAFKKAIAEETSGRMFCVRLASRLAELALRDNNPDEAALALDTAAQIVRKISAAYGPHTAERFSVRSPATPDGS